MKLGCIWMVPKNKHSPFFHQFEKKNDFQSKLHMKKFSKNFTISVSGITP